MNWKLIKKSPGIERGIKSQPCCMSAAMENQNEFSKVNSLA